MNRFDEAARLVKALVYLNRLITEEEWEFPDACYKACTVFHVDACDLRAAYDEEEGKK